MDTRLHVIDNSMSGVQQQTTKLFVTKVHQNYYFCGIVLIPIPMTSYIVNCDDYKVDAYI